MKRSKSYYGFYLLYSSCIIRRKWFENLSTLALLFWYNFFLLLFQTSFLQICPKLGFWTVEQFAVLISDLAQEKTLVTAFAEAKSKGLKRLLIKLQKQSWYIGVKFDLLYQKVDIKSSQ